MAALRQPKKQKGGLIIINYLNQMKQVSLFEGELVKQYQQSTIYTGAPSALMMILNHFDSSFEISKENEFKIWQQSCALPTRSSSIFALANIAHQRKIPVKVIVGDAEYKFPNYRFLGYKLGEIEEATFFSELYLKETKGLGVPVEEREFDLEEIKKHLKQKKLLILRINAGLIRGQRSTANYIPVFDYKDGKFSLIDPRDGKTKSLDEQKMKEALETVKTKCHRDLRMAVFG